MSKSCLKTLPTRGTSEGGFSLVEVLVSIVVLSFGMLGMVGLQAAALQSNRDAKAQSAAVTLARELAEMMRGNKDVGIQSSLVKNPYLGDFTSPLTARTASYCLNVGASVTGQCSSVPIPTAPKPLDYARETAVANAQMTEWLARVEAELPSPRVRVCYDKSPYDKDGIPQWDCSESGGTVVIKMGWTRGTIKRDAATGSQLERATIPSVVMPLIAGSTL